MHHNRFFPQTKLLDIFEEVSEYATYVIKKGSVLYRAREYKNTDLSNNKEASAISNAINEKFPNLGIKNEDLLSDEIGFIGIMLGSNQTVAKSILDAGEAVSKELEPFWGFGKEECDAPPCEKTKSMRANPEGVRYLYATTDEKTAIMEMRPQIRQCYSVCEIEILRDIKLFDFTTSLSESSIENYAKYLNIYNIGNEFSKPNFGKEGDYIPTQYICEYIKKIGFEGIRFKSAVSQEGINVVLFNPNEQDRVYEIIGSKVYYVRDIKIDSEQILPLQYET